MMKTVRIFTQDLDQMDREKGHWAFTSDWDLPRKHTFTYFSDKDGEEAAEQAYHITNAPDSFLENEFEKHIAQQFRSTKTMSLTVGDVVRVGDEVEYLCAPTGWLSRRFA
jgi:nicotinamidase-related amidase